MTTTVILGALCVLEAVPLVVWFLSRNRPYWEYTCGRCGDHRSTGDDVLFTRWIDRHEYLCGDRPKFHRVDPRRQKRP